MGCITCSTGSCATTPGGCKNSGGCKSGGCNKVNSYDWLGNMTQPGMGEDQNIYEVRFKNTRKAFFKNVNRLNIITGDIVVVESDRGYDVGQISLGGILARLQMKKRKVDENSDKVKKIFRLASEEDVALLQKARSREQETLVRTRAIIANLKLHMKLSEVEYQGDNAKAIFYYIADHRVDFRELIKILASEFKIRVEMKQIGLRHEAGLVGGIGACGRELCCSTWLMDFKSVSTGAARYQNLSLNPQKISGQCSRLKCCLNYELDTYLDALKDIPQVNRIETEVGMAYLQKTDIFLRKMWFAHENESTWVCLDAAKVLEIKKLNEKGVKPPTLQAISDGNVSGPKEVPIDFVDVVGQAKPRDDKKRKKKKKKKPQDGQGQEQQKQQGQEQRQQKQQGQEKRPENKNSEQQNQQRQEKKNPNQENRDQKNRGPENRNQNQNQNRGQNRDNRNNNRNRGPRNENKGADQKNKNQGGDKNNPQNPPPPPPPQQ